MDTPEPSAVPAYSKEADKKEGPGKFAEGAFLFGVAGIAALFGFGATLAMAKRRDPRFFTQGLIGSRQAPESGTDLALRALGWGTLYSIAGFTACCCLVWKLTGATNFEEFRNTVGSVLPKIPKKEPQGRSDFASFRELFNYCAEESNKKK